MSKNLVIYERNNFSKITLYQRFNKIFIENNYKKINGYNKKYIKVNQFYNAIETKKSDFLISKNINKIFQTISKINSIREKDEDLINAKNTFKQKIALYACDIQRSFTFAKLIKKKFKLKDKISIETNIFNYKVYKTMKKLNLLEKNMDFTIESKILSFLFYYFKNIYFFFKIFFIVENKLLKTKFLTKSRLDKKKKLISIFTKDIKFNKNDLNLSFLENKNTKKNIIYVTDEKDKINSDEPFNNKIINLEKDILKRFNFFYFIRKFYFLFSIKKLRFLILGIKNPIYLNVIYKSLNSIINWKLFYILYETKFHLNAMSDEKIFIKNTHNDNNVKTIFLYFSTTEELIPISNKKGFTRVNYVYLNYDYLVADKISTKLFKSQKIKVDKFIQIGNIGSDIIQKNQNSKQTKINKKKIKLSKKTKIISIFDHSIGRDGVWNQSDYLKLLNNIYLLIKKYNFQIIYKSKKTSNELHENFSPENKELFDKILKNKKFKYFEGGNKVLSSFQIISLSDLVITAPVSSIISETLCASKKVLVYDPNGNYKSKRFFIGKMKELYCKKENSFIFKLFKIIKMQKSMYSKKVYNNFIQKELGLKKFGSNLQNFKKTLENEL